MWNEKTIRFNIAISSTNLEPDSIHEPLAKKGAKRLDKKVNIHINSLRYRLADPDGISAKAAIDGLVDAGVLPDDSAIEIEAVTYSQKRVSKKDEEEMTIITIYPVKIAER